MFNKKFIIDLGSPKVRKNILIYGVAFFVLMGSLVYWGISNSSSQKSEADTPITTSKENEITKENIEEKPISIYVDVNGAVNQPSVIVLAEGSRVLDAIEAAGGLREDANISQINRAEILTDGAYIHIPTNKEIEENLTASAGTSSNISGSSNTGPVTAGTGTTGALDDKININTADSATLQQLNGVGPATADKIINYRTQSGKFSKIEDLKKVSGIGDKTFEKLKPYIKI